MSISTGWKMEQTCKSLSKDVNITDEGVPNCMKSKTPVPSGFLPRKHLGVVFVEDSNGDYRKMGHLTRLWQGRSSR